MPQGDTYKRSAKAHSANQKRKKRTARIFASLVKDGPQEALKKIAKSANPRLLHAYLKSSKTALTDFVNLKDKDGNNILHLALLVGNTKLFEYLTKTQANFDLPNNMNETTLHIAAKTGNYAAFKQLVQAGAKQDVVDRDGLTPIQRVMGLKDEFVDKFLKIPKIDLNIKNKRAETALHRAIDIQDFSSANKLFEKKVDINAQDNNGKTALHLLVVKEYPTEELNKLIEKMISSGANLFLPDKEGKTAFNDAIAYGKIETVEKLITIAQTSKELSNDKKIAIIKQARKTRHDYDILKIADALGVDLAKIKFYTQPLKEGYSIKNNEPLFNSTNPSIDKKNSPAISIQNAVPNLQAKKDEFIKKLKLEYGENLTPSFLVKAKEYINDATLDNGKIVHDDKKYSEYLDGKAHKGKSHKFAELFSKFRNTDNKMIQEIANQFHKYATKDNHQVLLPKRYSKIQTNTIR